MNDEKIKNNSFLRYRMYQKQLWHMHQNLEKESGAVTEQYRKDLANNNTLIYEKGMKEFKEEVSEVQKQCVMLLKQRFKNK